MNKCSVEACPSEARVKGLCNAHYKRLWKYGDPLGTGKVYPRGLTFEERFLRYVDKTDPSGCWRWTGKINTRGRGYGVFSWRDPDTGKPVTEAAHRVAYKLWVGPIPDGLDLDHVRDNGCVHTDCVRAPDHLEPVTEAENTRRYLLSLTECRNGHPYAEFGEPGITGQRCRKCRHAAKKAYEEREKTKRRERGPLLLKTHCKNGHEFTPENTKMGGKLGTTRLCKQCSRDVSARWKARQLATSSPD